MNSTWKWSRTDSWGWWWGGPEAAGSRGPNGSRGPATAAAGPPHSQARTLPGGHPSWGTRSAKCPATKCWLKPHPINNATANCDYFRLSLISKEFQEKKTVRYLELILKVSTRILKGLSHEIFGPVYWPVWMYLGLNKNRFWFLNLKKLLRYETAILSFVAFQFNSRRFLESPRRIGNWVRGSPRFI